MLASAHLIRNERHEAAQSLELSLNSGNDDSSIKDLLIQVHLELCRLAGSDEVNSRAEHFRRVKTIDPDNDELLRLAAQFLFSLDAEADAALLALCRTIVEQAIRDNTLPPDVYVILGTGAASQGKLNVGEKYLRTAYDHGVRSSSLLNNLAWVVSQNRSGDLAFALQLVDASIRSDPSSLDAYLTRADIHIALANHLAAIADLERVYATGDHSSEITQRLAGCYEAIGETDIANGLRQRTRAAR